MRLLRGGGVCGALVRSLDWAKTPLGPISSWPASLINTIGIVLHSRHPMFLFWGPEFVFVYNDAFLPSLGSERHPASMGQRGPEWARDVWPIIGPQIEDVMAHGKASWNEDHLIPLLRNGQIEEAYWTYSYSPAFDDDGSVGGAIVVCTETTQRVLAERRGQMCRVLTQKLATVIGVADLSSAALEILRDSRPDVPFTIAYDPTESGTLQSTVATVGDASLYRDVTAIATERVRAARLRGAYVTPELITFPPLALPNTSFPDPVTRGFLVHVPLPSAPHGKLIVFGLNPRLPFDTAYQSHLEQIITTMAHARSRIDAIEARAYAESERRDLLLQAPLPTILLSGPEHRFELANPAFIALVDREVGRKTFVEAFPELTHTALPGMLDHVYRTGEPFGAEEQLVSLRRGDQSFERWVKFNLQPLRDHTGQAYGMLGTIVDITDAVTARLAIEKLSSEREKLLSKVAEASRAKDEFLAMLGHELRNPLAPITTALHLMKLKDPTALAREREIIERQAAHLIHLVDDLLDIARVARGKVTLTKSRIALGDVIGRAVEIASPLYEQKQHVLTIDVPATGLDVLGDSCRLGQVFANLLTNAAKYTPTGGRITVKAERIDDVGIVRVEDNGSGISPSLLPHVFEAFFQEPRSPDRAQGGLGLGLALVKNLIALHGGTVTAESGGDGAGSVFEVRLPLLTSEEPAFPIAAPAPCARVCPSLGRRVLLVDDSDDILEIVSTLLRLEGYEVMAAHDGPTALQVASAFHPEVAVLDIGLPAMDGYDLAQHLQQELGERAPRLIAMTGYGQEADRERARQAGFVAHLVKPVDPSALLASVRG